MADTILSLLLKVTKEGAGATQVNKELQQFEKESKKGEAAAKKLDLKMAALGATAGLLAKQAFQIGKELLDMGIEMNLAESAVVALTGSSEAATEAIEAIQEGADGVVDRLTAAQSASRLFALGLVSTADEAKRFTEIATTLGASVGTGPQEAFEQFALILANQSIPRLDSLGISAGRVRERMRDLRVAMPEAGREAIFLEAAMAEAEVSTKKLEDAGFEAADSVTKLETAFKNLKIEAATIVADALMPMIDNMLETSDVVSQLKDAVEDGIITQEEYADSFLRMRRGAIDADEALAPIRARMEEFAEIDATTIDSWALGLYDIGGAAGEASSMIREIALSLGELREAELAREAMQALDQAWAEGSLSSEEYKIAFTRVADTMTDMDSMAIGAQLALFDIKQALNEGKDDALLYVDALSDFGQKWGILTDKTITLTVITEFEGMPIQGYQHGGSFTIQGPPGPDRVPVFFMGTAGEEVNISSRTQPSAGGGSNFNAPLIGNYYSNRQEDDFVLLERMRRALRREL